MIYHFEVKVNKKFDKEENKLTQWENDLSVDVHIEEYITAFHNGHLRVYNKKGEEVFKCPSKVQEIHQFEKDIFVMSFFILWIILFSSLEIYD